MNGRAPDPAQLEPPRFRPTRCRVCDRCWFDTKFNGCVYAGPYAGYALARTGEAVP